MAAGAVIPLAVQTATDADNRIVPGALAYFTAAGTSIPYTVYADQDLTVPLSHPVVASGAGRFPVIFSPTGVAYNLDITDPLGESLPGYPVVNVSGPSPSTTSGAPELLYPVGSIYMNATVATNPATLLGFGVWSSFGQGRVLIGIDTAQSEFDTAGETGGAKTVALTAAEMPAHTHVQNAHNHAQDAHGHTQNAHGHTATDSGHVHGLTDAGHTHAISDPGHSHPSYGDDPGGSHIGLTEFGFSDTIHSGGAPIIAALTGITGTGGNNTTGVSVNSSAAVISVSNATATTQNATATNQAATATNQNTGGDGAHNNLPPYLVVYMWLRTA